MLQLLKHILPENLKRSVLVDKYCSVSSRIMFAKHFTFYQNVALFAEFVRFFLCFV